jgi:hypothetical protein
MSKFNIICSSTGVNAEGKPVITPVSTLSYTVAAEGHSTVYSSLATDTVRYMICPLWARKIADVSLPNQRIFDHVSIDPALIRHWLKHVTDGGLFFPRSLFDMKSKDPCVQIEKRGASAIPSSTQVDLTLYFFRRTVETSSALQPFDSAVWHPDSYEAWVRMHAVFALVLEEECSDSNRIRLQCGACEFFRRIMHTHFADFGLVFGKLWWEFGLRTMVGAGLYDFMRDALMDMFLIYHSATPLPLPPLFDPVTVGSGQRICANCLTFRLGTGQMMRCPCRQVYYCSVACQKADWRVHRVLCTGRPASD